MAKFPKINANAQENDGSTALMDAALNGKVETIRELVKLPNIDINLKDKFSKTALIIAAEAGKIAATKELAKLPNIDIHLQNDAVYRTLKYVEK